MTTTHLILAMNVILSSSIQISAFTPLLHHDNIHIVKRHPSILPLHLLQNDEDGDTTSISPLLSSSYTSSFSSKIPLFQSKNPSFLLSIVFGICTWLGVCDFDALAANAYEYTTTTTTTKPSPVLMTSTLVTSDDMIGSSVGGINLKSIQESLVSPTDEKPQITMQGSNVAQSSSKSTATGNTKYPIMEGMVYLLNDRNVRPDLNDNIILTLSSTSNPDNILAGAKYKVYKAKFPFNFKMYDGNILKGKEEEWKQLYTQNSMSRNGIERNDKTIIDRSGGSGDFLVTARICPEDITVLPCKEEESTYFAKGVSKLLQLENLPGAKKGDIIRTAVSLPLQQQLKN